VEEFDHLNGLAGIAGESLMYLRGTPGRRPVLAVVNIDIATVTFAGTAHPVHIHSTGWVAADSQVAQRVHGAEISQSKNLIDAPSVTEPTTTASGIERPDSTVSAAVTTLTRTASKRTSAVRGVSSGRRGSSSRSLIRAPLFQARTVPAAARL
jgi:hypothetical protein